MIYLPAHFLLLLVVHLHCLELIYSVRHNDHQGICQSLKNVSFNVGEMSDIRVNFKLIGDFVS